MFKSLLLPLMAGLMLYAFKVNAKEPLLNSTNKISSIFCFLANKGQVVNQHQVSRSDIDFKLSTGNGLNIFIGKDKIEYQWAKTTGQPSRQATLLDPMAAASEEDVTYEMYRMDVTLIGANRSAKIIQEEAQSFYERYYLPTVPEAGAIARSYRKITYKNIYPHIDWVFYFNNKGRLEHDFVVWPGGKVSDIQIRYGGTSSLQLLADGSLQAITPMGNVTENAPYSYDEQGRVVASRFVLEDKVVRFQTDAYAGTITIDPTVEWGTYFGGSDNERSLGIATDKYGNVYTTGSTASIANIATVGAYQTLYGGGIATYGADAFLNKFNAEGALLWASYYGGATIDVGKGVACDTSGNVYLGGYTQSVSGIATTGSYQDTKAGIAARYDAFIAKFDSAGTRVWGTYFGGIQNEASGSMGLSCDNSNNLYLTGNTQSTSGIATPGTYQTTFSGGHDAFLAKFNTNGALSWASYYGGNNADYPYKAVADTAGNIYLTGYTNSTNGIATPGAAQPGFGGDQDAFICKFTASGQLLWGTYYGGSAIDRAYSITTQNDKVFIAGATGSTTNIATPGAYQAAMGASKAGVENGMLLAMNGEGTLLWATYYGGVDATTIVDIWSNVKDGIYIVGQTRSDTGIATPGSLVEIYQGGDDFFLTKFSATGQRLWGTYYGGVDAEGDGYIAGYDNSVYITGQTYSGTGIATKTAHQATLGGSADGALIKFNDCDVPLKPEKLYGNISVCSGSEQLYYITKDPDTAVYVFLPPEGWKVTGNTDTSVSVIAGVNNGLLHAIAISSCGSISDTLSLAITVHPLPQPDIFSKNNVLQTIQTYDRYQWILEGTDIAGAHQSSYNVTENGRYSVRVGDEYGCENTSDTISITGITGIETPGALNSFSLYPNPASDYIVINTSVQAAAQMFTLEGRLLRDNIKIRAGENIIHLKNLGPGVYGLKIRTTSFPKIYKFIVQ